MLLFWSMSRVFSLFGHCYVTFQAICSFLACCHVIILFLEGLYEKIVKLCCWDSTVQKTNHQSDDSSIGTSDIHLLCKLFKKQSFVDAKTHEKCIVYKGYSAAHQYDKRCILPNCRAHIILIGGTDVQLQKLDAFCFTYEQVDWLYQISIRRKILLTVIKFLIMRKKFYFNQRCRAGDKMPSIAKKDRWEKNK